LHKREVIVLVEAYQRLVGSSSGTDRVNSFNDDGDTETSSSEDVSSTRDSDSGEDSDSSNSGIGDLKDVISAQIPNYEIRSLFRQWLLDHFMNRMKHSSNIKADCIVMLQNMVSGSIASFAKARRRDSRS